MIVCKILYMNELVFFVQLRLCLIEVAYLADRAG